MPNRGELLANGEEVDVYRIDEHLGEGTLGFVYRATHIHIGGQVALKILRRQLMTNPELVERFVREARLVNDIHHPNVVNIFGTGGLPDGRPYYVMEYLEGRTLARELELRKTIPLSETIALLRPVARALDAAHQCGVLHHRLAEQDIFLIPDPDRGAAPRVKLLDFGHASQPLPELAPGASSAGLDNAPRRPPERIRDRNAAEREDIYSLGAIAYRMLTGSAPWSSTGAEVSSARRVRDPLELNPTLPAQVGAALLRSLDPDPSRRYEQGGELIQSLELAAGAVPSMHEDVYGATTVAMNAPSFALLETQLLAVAEAPDDPTLVSTRAPELHGGGSVSSIEIEVPPVPQRRPDGATSTPLTSATPFADEINLRVPRSPLTWIAVFLAAGFGGMLVAYLWPADGPTAPTLPSATDRGLPPLRRDPPRP